MRRRWSFLLLFLAVVTAGAYAGRQAWLPALGHYLVDEQAPEKAEIIVVLAGDSFGQRILRAAELANRGYAPRILVDGAGHHYGFDESELAIEFAVKQGVSREILEAFEMPAQSTMEEARLVDAELRRRGIGKALVVTSNFHTSRSRFVFDSESAGEIEYIFVAAPHPNFDPATWWHDREGRATLVLEYLKTLNSWFE